MIRTWLVFSAFFTVLAFTPTIVFGQDDSGLSLQQQEQLKREKAEREKSQAALRDFLNDRSSRRLSPGASAELKTRFLEFRLAIPKFRTATDDFRWALSLENKFDKPLKTMESQIDVLLRYFEAAKIKHPRPDALEFKDYSPSELAWETLNSAERISATVDYVVEADRQDVVSAKTLEFLYTLDGELLRLKWLTTHTR